MTFVYFRCLTVKLNCFMSQGSQVATTHGNNYSIVFSYLGFESRVFSVCLIPDHCVSSTCNTRILNRVLAVSYQWIFRRGARRQVNFIASVDMVAAITKIIYQVFCSFKLIKIKSSISNRPTASINDNHAVMSERVFLLVISYTKRMPCKWQMAT